MAARKRILVMVSPELDAALMKMAELSGGSKASICGEMLEQSLPVIQQMNKALEAAKNKQADVFELLNTAINTAVGDAQQMGLEIDEVKRGIRRWGPNKKKGEE